MNLPLSDRIRSLLALTDHPHWERLIDILCGPTGVSSAGYPYISDTSFRLFVDRVPHLFHDGARILQWLGGFMGAVGDGYALDEEERQSLERAARVIRTMVYTAGVTAPSDLWLLRHVIGVHRELGILDALRAEGPLQPAAYAKARGFDARQLGFDWGFLHTRGYLEVDADGYRVAERPELVEALEMLGPLPAVARGNLVPAVRTWIETGALPDDARGLESWWTALPASQAPASWMASARQIAIGYRLVPTVLALRVMDVAPHLTRGTRLGERLPACPDACLSLLEEAGLVARGIVTSLGQRVFQRGPGPFGIIAAYHPYLARLEHLLQRTAFEAGVSRAENVAASQDANRKTFEAANDALDAYCEATGFQYRVFIEHAVGQGEATRQRYARSGDTSIRYFGADLEDAAIDQAVLQQERGALPANMTFIRQADIGEPARVVEHLRQEGLDTRGAVMMVGNGFHEIRNQSNERMIAVFRAYQEAGILLIFTEESALGDDDLRMTAWNTYHAGFRYVHEMSGQGLRPIWERDGQRWGWRRCATEAGYTILDDYCYRTRTIYPQQTPERENPAISVTYFCEPACLRAGGEEGR